MSLVKESVNMWLNSPRDLNDSKIIKSAGDAESENFDE